MNTANICNAIKTGYNQLTATPLRSMAVTVGVGVAVATAAAAVYAPYMVVDRGANLLLRQGFTSKMLMVGPSIALWLMGKAKGLDILASLAMFASITQIGGLLLAMVEYSRCGVHPSACEMSPGCRFVPECQGQSNYSADYQVPTFQKAYW